MLARTDRRPGGVRPATAATRTGSPAAPSPTDVIPAIRDWAAAPDAVSGAGVPGVPDRLTTADDATGHDVAVGTETGAAAIRDGCVRSTPTSLAATGFGSGGAPPGPAAADAGIPATADKTSPEIATATLADKNRKLRARGMPVISYLKAMRAGDKAAQYRTLTCRLPDSIVK
jgi:hypothetical protein